MRAKQMIVSALTLGLAAGYAWSAMPSATAGPVAAVSDSVQVQSTPSQEAVEHSVYYPSCAAARAAGHAPIFRGQPGYRSDLDADGDGIACEPYRGTD
jgi:hypothetical protein